jgi:RimJ/RimL family protein N-acetyltransferase
VILLTPKQRSVLNEFVANEGTGPMVLSHVVQTGNGSVWVDRWPIPRAIIAETAGNYVLIGDPRALNAVELQERIRGFVAAPPEWLPALESAFTTVTRWERVILELKGDPHFTLPGNDFVRRLAVSDAGHLQVLSPATAWIAKTWGGPAGLAASGYAWGAFADGRLVSVACTFFVGFRHEDLGVATEPGFERRGLSTACAGALCGDVLRRGRHASWTTSPDNLASLRVAEKLGFEIQRRDWLYVIGVPVPN